MIRRAFLAVSLPWSRCLGPFGLRVRADAQQPASPRRIGVLLMGFAPDNKQVQGLRQGLQDLGYTEGRDVVFEWLSAEAITIVLPS